MLALLFGWLGISAYRKKRTAAAKANATIVEADLSGSSVFSASIAPPPSEQESSQFSATVANMAGRPEAVDPVVEADTFLAFGRDTQAEEILLDALKADPQRQALHLKLLDIYSARKNISRFQSVALELRELTGGTGASWEKAVAMGAALDPANPLYGSAPSEVPPAPADAALDMDATLILSSPISEQPAPQVVAAEPEATAAAAALDFDLDIGTADVAGSDAAPAAAEADPGMLDFDLDLGALETTTVAVAAPQTAGSGEVAALDIDFEMPAAESAATVPDSPLAAESPSAPAAAAADSNGIDFDFDLAPPEAAAAAPLPEISQGIPLPAPVPEPAPLELDLGSISLELDTPAATPAAEPEPVAAEPESVAAEPESVAAEPESVAAEIPDNPDVATKIELAMAYEEMGDRDGARELFQEAMAEGSPAQQKVARAKFDSLG